MYRDKRVVLTGPAPHILDSIQNFDDYDFVCRLNMMIPLSERLIECTGNRVDVWYCANKLLVNRPDLCLLDEVKLIRGSKLAYDMASKEIQSKWSFMNDLKGKRKTIGCQPNRGMKAIMDIIMDKPKELYITGITFYQGHSSYFNNYAAANERVDKFKGDIAGHLQGNQIEYFKKNIYPLPFVKVDSVLEKILKDYK